jgi:hypothetical protein
MTKVSKQTIAVRVWIGLLPLELAACILSYWTIGWYSTYFFICASIGSNFFIFVVYIFKAWPGIALAWCYGFLIIGYQTVLGIRWHYVHAEAESIIKWVMEEQENGGIPEDLSRYDFKYPGYKDYFLYTKSDGPTEAKWTLYYFVGTRATDHRYDPKCGWYYNDD